MYATVFLGRIASTRRVRCGLLLLCAVLCMTVQLYTVIRTRVSSSYICACWLDLDFFVCLLGQLLWVVLIKWVSNVRPSVHKTLLWFQWNLVISRGRRVMHDGMQYDPTSRSRALESRKICHFQRLFPPPFIMGAGKWPWILKSGGNT